MGVLIVPDNSPEHRLTGLAKDGVLTIDDVRAFIAQADSEGFPGDTQLSNIGVTWRGQLHRISVKGRTR